MSWWHRKPDNRDERLRVAEEAAQQSEQERAGARELARDLRQLHSENHITERIHNAMRGGERS